MSFIKIMHELRDLCQKADVSRDVRISMSFVDEGDKARFLCELEREFDGKWSPSRFAESKHAFSEFRLHGITVRIL